MNGERGMDLNTDFQRAYISVSITEEKTSLLRNDETKEFLFIDEPTTKDGYSNYHLHIYFPEKDKVTGRKNDSVKGHWSFEHLSSSKWRNGSFVGPYAKPVLFDPEIHSNLCKKILASTESLMGTNPEWIKTDFDKHPHFDRTKKKDVYNICNSLVEEYAKMQGKLEYVMVQPFYSSHQPLTPGGKRFTSVEYKTDVEDFIAVFPAIAYNKASLENQLY